MGYFDIEKARARNNEKAVFGTNTKQLLKQVKTYISWWVSESGKHSWVRSGFTHWNEKEKSRFGRDFSCKRDEEEVL